MAGHSGREKHPGWRDACELVSEMVDICFRAMARRNSDQTGVRHPLKVLHVIPSVSSSEGGPSYAVRAFAAVAKSRGVETFIVTTRGKGSPSRNSCSDA